MKNLIKILLPLFYIFSFISCSSLFSNNDENDNANKTYISVNLNGINNERAINPDFKLSDFTDYILTGNKEGQETKTLAEWTDYTKVSNTQIVLENGTWTFTLVAKNNSGIEYKGILENKEIIKGSNSLNFILRRVSLGSGTGNISLKLAYPYSKDDGISVTAKLCDPSSYEVSVDSIDYTEIEGFKPEFICENGVGLFSVSDLSAGDYLVEYTFNKEGLSTKLNSFRLNVTVASNYTTTGSLIINGLTDVYIFTKHISGSDDEAYTYKEGTTITLDYSLEKDGYSFDGWYSDGSFSSDKKIKSAIFNIEKDADVYGRWLKNLSSSIVYAGIPSFTLTATDTESNSISDGGTVGYNSTNTSVTFAISNETINSTDYTIQWLLNGNLVSGETGTTYTLSSLSDNKGVNSINCIVSKDSKMQSSGMLFTIAPAASVTETCRVALFNTSSNFGIFSDISTAAAASTDDVSVSYTDYCFDASGNFYYMQDNNTIYRFLSTGSELSEDAETIYQDTSATYKSLFFDLENDVLYAYNPSGLLKISGASTITDEDVDYADKVSTITLPSDIYNSTGRFAIYNDYLYTVYRTMDTNYNYVFKICKFKISGTSATLVSSNDFSTLLADDVKDYDYIRYTLNFTDIAANVNGVYVLMRNVGGYDCSSSKYKCSADTYGAYSRGAVVIITDDLTLKSINGWLSDSCGTFKTASTSSPVSNTNYTNFKEYCPTSENEATKLYGPVRFIALKPKELIFADGGWYLDISSITNGTKCSSSLLTEKKRIVDFKLEDNSFSANDITNISLSNSITGSSGFSSGDYLYSSDYTVSE